MKAISIALIALTALLAVAWKRQTVVVQDGLLTITETELPDPTNHFPWMERQFGIAEVGGAPYVDDPEWQLIRFGHNRVPWIRFRRGKFGANWNSWEPTNTWFQSSFEPVAVKTNGVWLITFKEP